eukprot:741832_1
MALLLNLLVRLHCAFDGSIYAITPQNRTVYIILYVLLILTCIWNISVVGVRSIRAWRDKPVLFGPFAVAISMSVLGCLYCFISAAALRSFAKRLMLLTNLRAPSVVSLTKHSDGMQSVRLSRHQMKMIENTTRYVSLSNLGILITFISVVLLVSIGVNLTPTMKWFQIVFIVMCVNSTVHVICLYLQYSFSTKYYEKYCVSIHLCWRYILTRKAAKALNKRYEGTANGYVQNEE